ncbi:MAG: hypothetical protein HETSPECPRED_010498 [Heterodermia speciosa]|uniref:Ankyrin n=1 Tax=Heterodermia speciosa TaxID=116794 RepID=A0A8H3G680_9LECA|nr:MAG: hypothetical protein HETSPECPRED_010498 [Heterodermia speciosa]
MAKITSPVADIDLPTTGEQYYSLIKEAIISGDLARVKDGLYQWQSDPSIPVPTPDQLNYLIPQAAKGDGQPEILEFLLSLGGKIGTHSIGVATSPDVFKVFMAHGWEVDDALLRSHVQHPQLIALFLNHGANPNSSGPRGFGPMDIAALHAPLETVKLLVDHGAAIGPSSAALHAAAQGKTSDRIAVMAFLVERGADVNGLAMDYPAPSEALRSGRKGTPLHTATKWAYEEAKTWLLEHGADPGAKNELGETPEQWGRRFEKGGHEAGLRLRRDLLRKN